MAIGGRNDKRQATSDKKPRRRYSIARKAQLLAGCDEVGASVAKVAMDHGINPNVVHRWSSCPSEGLIPEPPRLGNALRYHAPRRLASPRCRARGQVGTVIYVRVVMRLAPAS